MTVHTEQGSPRAVLGFLRDRTCEVAVARLYSSEPDMNFQPILYDQLLIVVGSRSKWARQRRMTLGDLAEEPWVLAPPELAPGSPFLDGFRALGHPGPRVAVLSQSLNLRYGLLATGRYLTTIPETVLHFGPKRASIHVLPIKLRRWHVPTGVITLADRTLSPVSQIFIDCIRELARPLARRASN